MLKVIKPGKKEFIGTCRKCGCVFKYTIDDLNVRVSITNGEVNCPDCGKKFYHPDQSNSSNETAGDYVSEKEIQDTLRIFKQFNSAGEVKS